MVSIFVQAFVAVLQLFRWLPLLQSHGNLHRFCRSQYPCSFSCWDEGRLACL